MRLADFESSGDGDFPLFVTRVPDAGGAEEFEFRIAGPARLVEEMLADATIELTIDSTRKKPLESPQFDSAQEEEYRRAMWELAGLEDIDQLLKPNPPPPERESSVFASIRPLSGHGTSYEIDVLNAAMPAGFSLLFAGVWNQARAFATPASGDQDLSWLCPIRASSSKQAGGRHHSQTGSPLILTRYGRCWLSFGSSDSGPE